MKQNYINNHLLQATYLHRIIYIGEHTFQDQEHITSVFNDIIKNINDGYYNQEILTGLLVHYSKYFSSLIEVVFILILLDILIIYYVNN